MPENKTPQLITRELMGGTVRTYSTVIYPAQSVRRRPTAHEQSFSTSTPSNFVHPMYYFTSHFTLHAYYFQRDGMLLPV